MIVLRTYLALYLLRLASADDCNIGLYTRKTCRFGQPIVDEASCLQQGCCFDPNGPKFGKCYKKGASITFGGFSFTATVPPSLKNIPGVLSIGGEEGFSGSEIRLECNPLRKCKVNFGKQLRANCIRQGCCYKNGECYQNSIKILKLRDACPPGFSDPPKCNVIDPCEKENPCQNGGVCTFTGPGKFSCACKVGFSGKTCASNCKTPYIYGASISPGPSSTTGDYKADSTITISCVGGHQMQKGATKIRQCVDGKFQPLISLAPITCSRDCTVENQVGVSSNAQDTTVTHETPVTYTCDSGVSDKDSQLTRTCLNGTLSPTLLSVPIVCHQDCSVQVPTGASASVSSATVEYGESFTLSCSEGYTGDKNNVALHKCGTKGTITPLQSNFKCYPHCTAFDPPDTSHVVMSGGEHSKDHRYSYGTKLLYSCVDAHTHQTGATVETSCGMNGNFAPVNLMCNEDCSLSTMSDYLHNQGIKTSVRHGESVEFRCKSGYSNPVKKVTYQCSNSKFKIDTDFVCHKDCDIPTNDKYLTFSDEVTGAKIMSGTSFTISCQPPYTAETTSTDLSRECVDGNITPADLVVCRAACSPPKLNTAKVIGTIFNHGDSIVYECLPAHVQGSESKMTRTCDNGVTTPDPDTGKDKIVCYKPCSFTTPNNAILEASNSPTAVTTGSVYTHGTTFTLTCESTHTPVPGMVSVYKCENGLIDKNVDFSCTLDCSAPVIQGVSFTTLTKYSKGLSVTAFCSADQVLTGTAERTCGTDGKFIPALDKGKDIPKCNNPCTAKKQPSNTNYKLEEGGKKLDSHTYPHGTKLMYSCLDTYSHAEGQIVESSCNDGTFSPTTIDCKQDCDLAAFLKDKNYGHDKGNALTVLDGTVVKFHCSKGFSNPDETEITRTCDDSTFTPVKSFKCYQDCSAPQTVEHGSFAPGTAIKHGESQEFKCNKGYTDEGTVDKKPTCNDGQYNYDPAGTLKCNKDCTPEELLNGNYKTEGDTSQKPTYHHGEKIRYECNSKHSDSVDDKTLIRTCQFGHFSPKLDVTPIICVPDCEVPVRKGTQILYQGKLHSTLDSLPENHELEYKCTAVDTAFAVGIEAKRTCSEGKLSPEISDDFVCLPICPEIKLQSQRIDASHSILNSGGYRSGTVLTYSCTDGYVMPRRLEAKTVCGADGRYTIDPSTFSCLKTCTDPEKPKDGRVMSHSLTKPYRVGDRLTYECNNEYDHSHVTDAILTVECQKTGLYLPSLANSKIECKKNCKVIDIGNVELQSESLKHGNTYSYKCATGYSMIQGAHNQYECLDGTLDYKNKPANGFIAPLCILKCTIPNNLDDVIFKVNGKTVKPSDQVDHQTDIELSCPPTTHTAEGEASRKCENSVIVKELSGKTAFVCYQNCLTPDMSLQGGSFKDIPVSGGFVDHGKEAVLVCKNGFYNSVTSYKCEDGMFPVEDAQLKCYRDCTPEDIGNLKTSPSPIKHGSIFSYECNDDHSTDLEAKVVYLCQDGSLVDATTKKIPVVKPSCYKKCTIPNGLDDVIFKVNGKTVKPSDQVDHQTDIELSCPPTTHTAVGEASRKCEDSVIVKELSGKTAFVCYQNCLTPDMSLRGGSFKHIPVSGGFVDHGKEAVLVCKNGFYNSVTSYKCEDGKFPVEDAQLKCYKDCMSEDLPNLKTPPIPITHGSTFSYQCDDDSSMRLKANNNLLCQDGSLVDATTKNDPVVQPLCYRKCTIPNGLDDVIFKVNGKTVKPSDQVDHQTDIELSCPPTTHTAVGEASRKCEDSVIVKELSGKTAFVCYQNCLTPDMSLRGGSFKHIPVSGGFVDHGKEAVLVCKNGFYNSVTSYKCEDGKFPVEDAQLKCYEDCTPDSIGNLKSTPTPINHGSTFSYQCDDDHSMHLGANNNYLCKDGNLIDTFTRGKPAVEPSCHKICKIFTAIVGALSPEGPIHHGRTGTYTCIQSDHAFKLNQQPTRTCKNGHLDPIVLPENLGCYPKCPIPDYTSKVGTPDKQSPLVSGDTLTIVCPENTHDGFGEMPRTCGEAGDYLQNFEQNLFKCLQRCPIKTVNEATHTILSTTILEKSLIHGQAIKYTCNADFSFLGGKETLTICNDGNYNVEPGVCYRMCDVPDEPTYRTKSPSQAQYRYKQTFTFGCKQGWSSTDSHPQRKCGEGGVLDYTLAQHPFTCNQDCTAATPSNTDYTIEGGGTKSASHNYPHGTKLIYSCLYNANNVGGELKESTCNDGTFSAITIDCKQVCRAHPLPSHTNYQLEGGGTLQGSHVYPHNTKLIYSCKPNYSHQPGEKTESTCTDGTFSTATIDCKEDCPATPPSNTVYTINGAGTKKGDHVYPHNTELIYSCKPNYSHQPGETTESTCTDGTFSTVTIDCGRDCTATPPLNTIYTIEGGGTKKGDHVYPHNTKLIYSCKPNYSHQTGETTESTCTDGTFSTVTIDCGRDCTATPPSNTDYTIDGPGTKKGDHVYPHNTKLIYSCLSGYSFKRGQTTESTCRDSSFSTTTIDCRQECTAVTPSNTNYQLKGSGTKQSDHVYPHNTKLIYSCISGYNHAVGQTTENTCNGGTFSKIDIDCRQDCTATPPSNTEYTIEGGGTKKGDHTYPHNTKLIYSCLSGYSHQTGETKESTCYEGTFYTVTIDCGRDCTATPPSNTEYTIEGGGTKKSDHTYPHNTKLIYSCASSYTHAVGDTKKSTCTDGTFSTVTIDCGRGCSATQYVADNNYKLQAGQPQAPYTHKQQVTFVCDDNYGSAQTVAPHTCNDGTFSSSPLFRCFEKSPERTFEIPTTHYNDFRITLSYPAEVQYKTIPLIEAVVRAKPPHPDQFFVRVAKKTLSGFTAIVTRTDLNTGWGASPDIYWKEVPTS